MIYTFMIPVYGRLVQAGKYTVDVSDDSKIKVPERYVEAVCEWLAKQEG